MSEILAVSEISSKINRHGDVFRDGDLIKLRPEYAKMESDGWKLYNLKFTFDSAFIDYEHHLSAIDLDNFVPTNLHTRMNYRYKDSFDDTTF